MRGAHGDGVRRDGQRGIQRGNGDLKRRVAVGVDGQVLFAVNEHIVIVRAAPDDGRGHNAIGHGQRSGAFDGGASAAALQRHSAGVAAVGGDLDGCRSRILCRRLGIGDADRMVIPGALGTEDGQLEIGIDSRNGDVKAVYFVAGAVGVGHRVNGRLQPVALVGRGVGCHARIQVDDLLGLQTDVEGHRAVFHRQRAHAVHGFVGVEHTAVGVELSGVYAVRQRGSGGLGFRDGRGRGRGGGRGGFFRGDRLGRALGGGRCGRTAARQQQGSESQGCELELFHAFLTSFYIYIYQALAGGGAGGYGIRPYGVAGYHIGRRPDMRGPCRAFPKTKKLPGAYPPGRMGLSQPFRESMAAPAWST